MPQLFVSGQEQTAVAKAVQKWRLMRKKIIVSVIIGIILLVTLLFIRYNGAQSRVSISSIADDVPELKVIQMPFLYSNAQEMWAVLNGEDGRQFIDAIEESNLGVGTLSWYDAGARSFYSVKPVTAIQDLYGFNLRVQESELMSETVELFGANPVKMTY